MILPAQSNKTENTDYTNLYASYLPQFSGNWNNGSNAGTFYLNVNNSTSNTDANITAQLMFSIFCYPLRLRPELICSCVCRLASGQNIKTHSPVLVKTVLKVRDMKTLLGDSDEAVWRLVP